MICCCPGNKTLSARAVICCCPGSGTTASADSFFLHACDEFCLSLPTNSQRRRKQRGGAYEPITLPDAPAHRLDACTEAPPLIERHPSPRSPRAQQQKEARFSDGGAIEAAGTRRASPVPMCTLFDPCSSRQCYVCSKSRESSHHHQAHDGTWRAGGGHVSVGERQLRLLKGTLISADFSHSRHEPSQPKLAVKGHSRKSRQGGRN